MAMGIFELVATTELTWLFHVILYANAFRLVPASPVNQCGADLYHRILLTHRYLLLTALVAAALLLAVKAAVIAAQARALAAAAKALDADHEGIGSLAAGWKRRSIRGTLLLAVALSFAASVLAEVTFEDGFLYRIGCHADSAGYGFGAPLGVLVVGLFALLHGLFAWAAARHPELGAARA